jgi:hypothetical protein
MFTKALTAAIAAGVLSTGLGAGQTATKPPEPTEIGVFYYHDPDTQTLKPLPNERAKKQHSGAFTDTVSVVVSGGHSPFSIAASNRGAFAFKAGSPEAVKLFLFDVKDNQRKYWLGKRKGNTTDTNDGVPVEIVKLGESSYQVVPKSPLAPGEYAITVGPRLYTFGVVSSKKN